MMEKVEIRFYNGLSQEYTSIIVGPDDELCKYSVKISDLLKLSDKYDYFKIVLDYHLYTAVKYFLCLVDYGTEVDQHYKGPYHYGYSNLANVIMLAFLLKFDEVALMGKLLFPYEFESRNDADSDWFYCRVLYMCKVLGYNKLACYLGYFVGLPWCFSQVNIRIIDVHTFTINTLWFRTLSRVQQDIRHRYCEQCVHMERTMLIGDPFQSYLYKRSVRNPWKFYERTFKL